MQYDSFIDDIQQTHMINAIRNLEDIPVALSSPHKCIFLLTGNVNTIESVTNRLSENGKRVFVHIDMIEGIGKDIHGLNWLANHTSISGVMTTRSPLIKSIKSLGLVAVQRMFLLDSLSIETGLKLVKTAKPDFLEIMPGLMPGIIKRIVQEVSCPVIAGGMVKTIQDAQAILDAGAIAVSASEKSLWEQCFEARPTIKDLKVSGRVK